MPCLKCGGKLEWKDRSWTHEGEDPGHWRCIMCGKLIYPEKAGSQKREENVPEIIPSPDCDGEEEEMVETASGKKRCPVCGQEKPATNEYFGNNKAARDGLEYYCKSCKAKKQKDYQLKKLKEAGQQGGNGRKKRQPQNPGPLRSTATPMPSTARDFDERIYLPAGVIIEIQKAGERKVWEEIAKMAKERLS